MRVVVCHDQKGNSSAKCDRKKKPPEEISCNSEPCPIWNAHKQKIWRCETPKKDQSTSILIGTDFGLDKVIYRRRRRHNLKWAEDKSPSSRQNLAIILSPKSSSFPLLR